MPGSEARNEARYWEDPTVPGLGLMWADFTTHEYAPHTHDELVIAVTEAGGSVITSRGSTNEAQPSTLFVFNPGEPHSGHMGRSRRWRYRGLYLAQPAIAEAARRLGIASLPYFLGNAIVDRELVARSLTLHRTLDQERQDQLRSEELFCDTLAVLFARHGRPRPRLDGAGVDQRLVRRILDHIHARYTQGLSLEEMAADAGLTPFQVIRLVRRSVGMTPHAYLTQVRLDAARERLRRGHPAVDVAVAVGFYDQAALTRHFKKRYGITPRQFSAAVQVDHARTSA